MTEKIKRTSKPRKNKVPQIQQPLNHGLTEGQYSSSLWNNGELISFDIDWDKLAEIVKNIDKTSQTR